MLYAEPAHPYTKVLIDSIPVADPAVPPATAAVSGRAAIGGVRQGRGASGMSLRAALPAGDDVCVEVEPQLTPVTQAGGGRSDHFVACHHPLIDGTDGMTPH